MTDRYPDDRYRDRDWERGGGRRYRDESYYGGYYGYPEPRGERGDYGRGRRDDRGFFERAGDEVRSWFGDEEAERRRMRDEREEHGRGGGGERGMGRERQGEERRWGGYGDEDVDRDWARKWGYMDRQDAGRGQPRDWDQERRYGAAGMYGGSPAGYGYGASGQSGVYGGEGYGAGRPGYGAERGWMSSGWSAQSGPYAGRGPRGYTRPDERIREDVCERMSQHGQLDASDIEVRVTGAEVILQGSVGSRYAKRIAEDIAESVSGVREVSNQLRVTSTKDEQQGQQGQPGWGEQRHRAA
jgi:osmotically-inducible protein OsmY